MAARIGVFLLVSLIGTMGASEVRRELIVWNVGQGQWATIVDGGVCWHIDMGGEFAPWSEIQSLCRRRANPVSLSHWDTDHISFTGRARMRLPTLCLLNRPDGEGSARKRAMIDRLPACSVHSPFAQWSDPDGHSANAKSWVLQWLGVLAQGDSPSTEEKKWVYEMPLKDVRILILGHHGSRTSTSPLLLGALPHVKIAIASARYRRYHHPHAETIERLRAAGIPLLKTEDWGTIHVYL